MPQLQMHIRTHTRGQTIGTPSGERAALPAISYAKIFGSNADEAETTISSLSASIAPVLLENLKSIQNPISSLSTTDTPATSEEMAGNNNLLITAGPYQFLAVFEQEAPKTVSAFRKLLPYHQKIVHVRWSGEGVWVPLGDTDFKVGFENHTAHPGAGQILLYPGGFSETELLFCYGNVAFASKMGALAANHFITITEGMENLKALGNLVLWEGAQDVVFEMAGEEKITEFRQKRSSKTSVRSRL